MTFLSWARAPENRGTVLALGAATAAVVGWGAWSFSEDTKARDTAIKKAKRGVPSRVRGEGYLLCPADLGSFPGDTTGLVRGDFVIIELSAKDASFREATWAQVLSISPDGAELYIQIRGEYRETGVHPLSGAKHGYHINDRMIIPRTCVFDMLHVPAQLEGKIPCGPELSAYTHEDTGAILYTPKDTSDLSTADLVQIVLADTVPASWNEPVWVVVTSISPTKNIITGFITDEPTLSDRHKLRQYAKVSFNRDCVVGVRHPFIFEED